MDTINKLVTDTNIFLLQALGYSPIVQSKPRKSEGGVASTEE